MIDWHSHILPGVDDGSRDVEQSLAMLEMLRDQGVHTVVATPHFFANDESVDSFLDRRSAALEKLEGRCPCDVPKIVPGAEVKYYEGISRLADLRKLGIEGSDLLLLEMPMTRWTEYTFRELTELASTKGLTVMLAHVERYLKFQRASAWDRLYECGIRMQVNASFFNGFTTRHKALHMLNNADIHFIGSDCHNTTSRAPRIGEAFAVIRKKLGSDFLNQMNEYGHTMFT